MRNVSMGLLILITAAGVCHAAQIVGVTATASDEYIVTGAGNADPHTGTWVNGRAANVTNGSGFNPKRGWHYSDGFREPGTMWIASFAPEDPQTWIEFDLPGDQTLEKIKVWNGNHTGEVLINNMGGPIDGRPYPQKQVNRLGMGVRTMNVVLINSAQQSITTFENVSLSKAPGLANVDFGQEIDIAGLNGGTPVANVRYVRFDILSNYDDFGNLVALSEVLFYNDLGLEVDAGQDQRVWLTNNYPDPNSVTVLLDGFVTPGFPSTWTVVPYDPNIIVDPNSPQTAAIIETPGVYTFTLDVPGIEGSLSTDIIQVRALEVDDDGLLGWWPLNDGTGTTAVDLAGNKHAQIITYPGAVYPGYPKWVSEGGIFDNGPALSFKKDGRLRIPNTNQYFDQLNDEMTITLWFKADPTPPTPINNNQKLPLAETSNWHLAIVTGRLAFWATSLALTYDPGGDQVTVYNQTKVAGTTNVMDGQWHFAALTYDGRVFTLYVDGRKEGQAFAYDRKQLQNGLITPHIRVGQAGEGYNDLGFTGLMNDYRLYTIALGQNEIVAAYLFDGQSGRTACGSLLYGYDIDGDCRVNLADFAELARNWLH